MNEIEKFDAMLRCDFDLLEVLFQFSTFQDYVEHLEKHAQIPRNREFQSAKRYADGQEVMARIEEIEHKYSVLLPLRQRYSYAVQLTSILEWSMIKILTYRTGKIPEKRKFTQLLEQLEYHLDIKIGGKQYLRDLYKFRNKVSHANGNINENEEQEWACNKACEVIHDSDGLYLLLDMVKFRSCMNEAWLWISMSCTPYNKAIHATSA